MSTTARIFGFASGSAGRIKPLPERPRFASTAIFITGLLIAAGMFAAPAWAAPGKKIGELKADGLNISISSSGAAGDSFDIQITNKGAAVGTPEVFALENPTRLVIDLPKVEVKASKKAEFNNGVITGIRLGVHPGKARIVLDLVSAAPPVFAVSAASGAKPLEVKLSFGAAAAGTYEEFPEHSVDLSDLPKPDAEARPAPEKITAAANTEEHAKSAAAGKVAAPKPGKESEIITAPKNPVQPKNSTAEAAELKNTIKESDPELEKSLKALAEGHGDLKPAPDDIDADFQDLLKEEPAKKTAAGDPKAAAEAAKAAVKEPLKESLKTIETKTEPRPVETELSDDEALKMLELAGEVTGAKKTEAAKPEPVKPESSKAQSAKIEGKGKTLADLAEEPAHKGSAAEQDPEISRLAAAGEEEGSPEQLAKLLNESEAGEISGAIKTGGSVNPAAGTQAAGAVNPLPSGTASVKGIFYRAAEDGKTSAVVIEVGNLNNYSLSQKKKNLYELSIDQASLAGEHVAYPQFPPDTFQGFEAVLAEQQGTAVVVKLYVAEGTKLSPFRVKDQLWVKVLK